MSDAMSSAAMIPLLAVLSIACATMGVFSFRRAVANPDRSYMDPLPGMLSILWPLVLFSSHYFGRFLSVEYLERVQKRLVHAGLNYRMSADQFVCLRGVCAILMLALCVLVTLPLNLFSPLIGTAAALFGAMIPEMKLRESRKRRERDVTKLLPTYLDFITMSVEAGLSLPGALVQATQNGPPGLFRQELETVNRDIKAGAGRIEALEAMSERLEMREVTSVVAAIAQAERSGGSVGNTLRIQAEQQRVERFQRAEKLAMEAPVKLIFPLVAFIFPTTFIVLGFPIAMKLLHSV